MREGPHFKRDAFSQQLSPRRSYIYCACVCKLKVFHLVYHPMVVFSALTLFLPIEQSVLQFAKVEFGLIPALFDVETSVGFSAEILVRIGLLPSLEASNPPSHCKIPPHCSHLLPSLITSRPRFSLLNAPIHLMAPLYL